MTGKLDELRTVLADAETVLADISQGVSARVELSAAEDLAYMRVGSSWGLYVLTKDADGPPPHPPHRLRERSIETAILAAGKLGDLAEAIQSAADERDARVREALTTARAFLAMFGGDA